jgi:hypothetical protein
MCNRRHEIRLKATQTECLPDEVDDLPDPNLLKNVGRLYGSGNSDKELIIGCRVLSLEKGRRAK